MPTRNMSGKPEHVHQNLNRKRKKSGKKYEKLIKHFRLLRKKRLTQDITGEKKWIDKAYAKANAKRIKLGLTEAQVQ